MSTLNVATVNATTTLNTSSINGGQLAGFRNKIINGDMVIDQRNAGAAVTASGAYPVDRFRTNNGTDGAFSAQQDSSAPAGFVQSLKFTTTIADGTLTGTQNLCCLHYVEGNNITDLAWGTASAKSVTLSFWVRSSLTGTFGGAFSNSDASRNYPFTYTISTADTWEYKTVTVAGDTSGTWLTTNDVGIRLSFGLGAGPDRSNTAGVWTASNSLSATGAVSLIGTLNATWYITGVQLELGSTATTFEQRLYGTELALCQRYYEEDRGAQDNNLYAFCNSQCISTTQTQGGVVKFKVPKRVAPTMTSVGAANTWGVDNSSGPQIAATAISLSRPSKNGFELDVTVASGLVAGNGTTIRANSSAAPAWIASAEL